MENIQEMVWGPQAWARASVFGAGGPAEVTEGKSASQGSGSCRGNAIPGALDSVALVTPQTPGAGQAGGAVWEDRGTRGQTGPVSGGRE